MSGKKLIIALFLLFALMMTSQAIAAPAIWWLYVQHRTNEGGTEMNLLGFGFKDATTGAPILQDKLESVVLYDPNGAAVAVSEPSFSKYDDIPGEYDGKTGIWNYGTLVKVADYNAFVEQELMLGTYHLVAVFDGTQVEATFTRTIEVDLPVVPASSIKTTLDASGNLIGTWAVSFDLSNSNPALATCVKVVLEVRKKGKIIGYLEYRVPTHLGRLFVPKTVVDAIKALGGASYAMAVNLRTGDNGCRTKSKYHKVVLK